MIKYFIKAFTSSYQEKSIASLDGLRAVSIIIVILGHASFMYKGLLPNIAQYFAIQQSLGVSIFFVISGFLINSFLIREKSKTGVVDLKLFYFKRLFRIFPPFYLYLALSFYILGYLSITKPTGLEVLSAATYTWNYVLVTNNWFYGHSWSLAVEEQFYMIWPIVFALVSLKFSKKMPIILIFIGPILRVATYFLFPEWRGRISIMFHTRVDTLMFGCLLAYYHHDGLTEKFNTIIKKYNIHLAAFVLLFLFKPVLSFLFEGKYTMTVGYSIEGMSVVSLLIYILYLDKESIVFRFLNAKIMCHVGILSYGLYLWQQFFLAHSISFSFDLARFLYLYTAVLIIYVIFEYPIGLLSKSLQKKVFE